MKQEVFIDGIVGARPNMMKMAPLAKAITAAGAFRLRLIHTGQHYDYLMSEVFFKELGLPEPDINLNVGSGTQGAQTARILEAYEKVLLDSPKPQGVIVVGDVNSTMACALAAVKLGIKVAHVEAGLRSGDRSMPEEINRIVTDSISDLLFVSDPDGLINLGHEGIPKHKLHYVGNLMMDTLFAELPKAEKSTVLKDMGLEGAAYAYVTLHRPSNVDQPKTLRALIELFQELSADMPFVFAVHPRTRARREQINMATPDGRVKLIPAQSYRDNLRLIQCAKAVLTDSGGIQEETSVLNIPCLTLRDTTERPVTVELGTSALVGNDPQQIHEAWGRLMSGTWKGGGRIPLWDGDAAKRITDGLRRAWR